MAMFYVTVDPIALCTRLIDLPSNDVIACGYERSDGIKLQNISEKKIFWIDV